MNKVLEYILSFPDPFDFADSKEKWISSHGHACSMIDCTAKTIYYPTHWTPLSIKLCTGGKEVYKINDGRAYCVEKGSYLILNEDTEYESYIDSPSPVFSTSINFTTAFVDSWVISHQPVDWQLDKFDSHTNIPYRFLEKLYTTDDRLTGIIQQLKSQPADLQVQFVLLTLLDCLAGSQLLLHSEMDKIGKVKNSTQYELYKRLHQVRDYIHACFTEEISLETLSKIACLNQFYFLRTFKSYFQVTPYQYLLKLRLQEATDLLLRGNTVSSACAASGFKDISSFCKLYKKQFGITPGEFLCKRNRDKSTIYCK